jgi:tetratricopeptide (TPR) repeat protein
MKADRRHELQENTLAHVLTNFPIYAQAYGGRVLTVLAIIVMIFALVRYRNTTKLNQAALTRESLASARDAIRQIDTLTGGMNSAAETANLPELPGATTQPALALPEKRDDLLTKAAQAYESVLSTYPSQKNARASALLGLAAIAENQGKFDEAKKRYEEVTNSDLASVYKTLAQLKLAILPEVSKPRRIVAATQAAEPMGQPFISQPLELPSTVAPPTTAPTTAPTIGL